MNSKQLPCPEKPPAPVVAVKRNWLDPSRANWTSKQKKCGRPMRRQNAAWSPSSGLVLMCPRKKGWESDGQLPEKAGALWPHGAPGTGTTVLVDQPPPGFGIFDLPCLGVLCSSGQRFFSLLRTLVVRRCYRWVSLVLSSHTRPAHSLIECMVWRQTRGREWAIKPDKASRIHRRGSIYSFLRQADKLFHVRHMFFVFGHCWLEPCGPLRLGARIHLPTLVSCMPWEPNSAHYLSLRFADL